MSKTIRKIPWAVPGLATFVVVAALIAVAAFPGTGQAAPASVTAAVPDPDPGQALLATWTSVAADTGAYTVSYQVGGTTDSTDAACNGANDDVASFDTTATDNDRQCLITGLTPNTDYTITVVNAADGTEVTSTAASATVLQLATPGNLQVPHNANPASLTVTWEAVADADGYQVQIQPVQALTATPAEDNSAWVTVADDDDASPLVVVITEFDVSGTLTPLAANTAYYVQVRATSTDATTSTDLAARRISAAAQTGDAGAFTSAYELIIENPVIRDLDLRVKRIVTVESATQASADTVNIRIANAAGTDIESYLTAGLAAAGAQSINDGQLTIRASDNSVRTFEIFIVCGTYDQVVNIEVYDREADLVARGSITCDPEPTALPPPDTDQVLGCFTIEGVRPGESDRISGPIDPFTTDASIQIVVTSYEMIFAGLYA